MTPGSLFLILVTVAGVSALRWSLRLAPLTTEFPAKTGLATLLAAMGAAHGFGLVDTPAGLRLAALILGPLYVFAPLLLLALVRGGRSPLAGSLVSLLYWTRTGRAAVTRLLAQAALQTGDASAARGLATAPDGLLVAQAQRLEGDWEGVLAAPLATTGEVPDNVALGYEARIEALIELGRLEEAEAETGRLKRFFEDGHDSPVAFRALSLATARLAAERGDVETVGKLLTQPLVGAAPNALYAIMARAAQRSGRYDSAQRLYAQAYAGASGALRERYAAELAALGAELPKPTTSTRLKAPVTYLLMATLVLAYLAQLLADRLIGTVGVLGQHFDASSLIAAYLQGLPGLPAADAWWRYITYAFVHGNLVHIGFNLWVLFDLGRIFERRCGWGDLVTAFFAGTVGGALLTGVMQAGQPLILVGASGGILGLAGALLASAMSRRTAADTVLLRSLLQWMALIMLFSVLPGVSLWGHVGGLLGGFAYGLLRSRIQGEVVGRVAGVASAVALALALVTAIVTVVPLLR